MQKIVLKEISVHGQLSTVVIPFRRDVPLARETTWLVITMHPDFSLKANVANFYDTQVNQQH